MKSKAKVRRFQLTGHYEVPVISFKLGKFFYNIYAPEFSTYSRNEDGTVVYMSRTNEKNGDRSFKSFNSTEAALKGAR